MSPSREVQAPEDFEAVLRRHEGLLRSAAKRYYLAGGSWDDLMQEASIGLWEAWRGYDPSRGSFATFAAVVVRRKLATAVTQSTRVKHRPLRSYAPLADLVGTAVEPHQRDASAVVVARDEWDRARALLKPLEVGAVILVLGHGYSYAEAGRRLGTNRKGVDNAIQRARRTLVRVED